MHPEHIGAGASRATALRAGDAVAIAAGLAAALLLVFAWLGGDRLVGDEHNAIHFLRDSLADYVRDFHYGHVIKVQFWTMHELFGNSFFWYRMPAALAAGAFLAWLALYRVQGHPLNRATQALVVVFFAANAWFLYFARWGMPGYAQSILVEAVLLGLVFADLVRGRGVRWTPVRLALIALLPWLYPATLVFLGAISASLWLGLGWQFLRARRASSSVADAGTLGRQALQAGVPLLLGGLSMLAYRLSVPDAHWARARGLHKSYGDWVEAGQGGPLAFVLDSLRHVGRDLLDLAPMPAGPLGEFASAAYALVGVGLACAVPLALVVALWRARRAGPALPDSERGFLRGSLFLVPCVLAGATVPLLASLVDAYPALTLRHLFFLLPVLCLACVAALAYLVEVTLPALRAPAARGVAAAGLAVVAIAFAAVVGWAALRERGQAEAAQARLLAAFHSEANDVTLAFAPGFFISPGTLPGPRRYFMIDSGDQVPAPAVQAVREKAAAGGGRMAVLLRSRALESGAIASFIAQQHLDVQDMLQSGPFAVLVLGIPAGKSDVALTTVETTVDVPAGAVLSVRLDPTAFAKVPVTIDELALADASGTHEIDLCADARLQLVRSVRLGETAEGCSFIMGNEANAGWLAPTQLRNLPAAAGPRRLKLRMSGELSDEIRFYFDTGSGYHSPLRLKTQDIDLPAGARAPADESAPGPVNAPLPVAR